MGLGLGPLVEPEYPGDNAVEVGGNAEVPFWSMEPDPRHRPVVAQCDPEGIAHGSHGARKRHAPPAFVHLPHGQPVLGGEAPHGFYVRIAGPVAGSVLLSCQAARSGVSAAQVNSYSYRSVRAGFPYPLPGRGVVAVAARE